MTSKILVDRDVLVQALEALNVQTPLNRREFDLRNAAITALRAALEEPVQEPVAIVGTREGTWKGYEGQWLPPGPPIKTVHMLRDLPQGTPLYTSPPQRKENNEPAAWMMTENPKYGDSVVVRRHKPKTYDADWWNVEPLYKLGDS